MDKNAILKLFGRCIRFFKANKKEIKIPDHNRLRRKIVDNNSIRARLSAQGWKLLEIPIKKHDPFNSQRIVVSWKIVASRGEKSLEVGGGTIDEALRNIGVALGVITRDNNI